MSAPEAASDFVCRMDQLAAATAFAEAFCASHGVADADALRLALVIEELFTNAVRYGHRGDSTARLGLRVQVTPGSLLLTYEDTAPAFDPLAQVRHSAGALDLPVEQRPEGGMGIGLVVDLARNVRYAFEDGCNRLWIELPRKG